MDYQLIESDEPELFNMADYERYLQEDGFIFVPKGTGFNTVGLPARCLYGMMLDKLKYEGMSGIGGRKYIHYPIEEIRVDMGYHRGHVTRLLKELEDCNLINRVGHGSMEPVDIYVNSPDKLDVRRKKHNSDAL